MMSDWTQHFVFDVEADGPCPGLYNMISFGLVSVADPTCSFLGEVAPAIDSPGIPRARAVSGISFDAQKAFAEPETVMAAAVKWLDEITKGRRPVFWSDNPAFDWQFWNWYCHKFTGENPVGFSARRVGDLDAGRRNDPFNASSWKKQRITRHTHNPVDDARGNAEGLRWVLQQMGRLAS